MLISSLTLLLLAGASTAVATWLAFAQFAIFSTIVEEETERPGGEDYASAALVTRILERPRAVYLQLAAVRTACRWITIGCLAAVGLAGGRASYVALAMIGAFILFILEEELPLRLVLRDPAGWAMRLLPPLALALQLLNGLSPLFEWTYRLTRSVVRNRAGGEPPMSVEELTMMAAAGGADLGVEERRILRGIFRSSGILVADIMTPRERMAVLAADVSLREALERFKSRRHSRLPVYDGTLDHVVGVAHARDFLRPAFEPEGLDGPIRPFLRDAYFVRQDRRIHELFDELREGKVHLAVVVDRMGRTVGLVTLEDILEEIVGEIHDELESEKVR
jgi:putative hemolysin